MKFLLRTGFCFAVLAAVLVLPANLLHGQVTYTVTGFVSFSNSAEVTNSQAYVANFEIDLSVEDVNPSPTRGEYPGAIVSSSIEFASGYTSQVDFTGGRVVIFQDLNGGGIIINAPGGDGVFLVADVGEAFPTDELFADLATQFLGEGRTESLVSLTEPSGGLIVSTSVEEEVSFVDGQVGRGPILLSISVSDPVVPGDLNLDGDVTFADIPSFIQLLMGGGYQDEADFNGNGDVDSGDLPLFIAALRGE